MANISLDSAALELVDLRTLAGNDRVNVHDLTGTTITDINVDLAASTGGGGDTQPDSIIVEGTDTADTFTISGGAGSRTSAGWRPRSRSLTRRPALTVSISARSAETTPSTTSCPPA